MAKQAKLTKSKNKVTGQRENRPVWNHVQRVNHQNKFVALVLLTKTGKFPVNAARQHYSSQAATTSTASKANTARSFVHETSPKINFYKTHKPNKRPFYNTTAQRTTFSYQKVNAIGNNSLSAIGGIRDTVVKSSAGNKAHLADYQEFKSGSVAFGGSNGRITGKGKIKSGRQHNMYSFNLKNIDPSGDLACLFVKALIDESNKWHRRLGHVNFKNLNKLVKGNLVRGLPFKIFENDHTCVACQKGKQHKAYLENHANKSVGPKEANNSACTQANDDQGDKIENNTGFKTCEKPVSQVEQVFLEELEKLKRYEKGANDAVESLRNAASYDIQNASTSSTNLINIASTPLSTADDPSMPHLEDIFASLSEGIFTDSSYDDEGVVIEFNNLETTVKIRMKLNKNSKAHALVKQKEDGIFISQDKYVAKILKKFDFLSVKTASTPIETQKPLVKDEEAADVDVHLYRSMIGSLMYLTASRPDIMFVVCACSRRLISWQCKKQTIVATSTIEAEYVAAAHSCRQVLWIQNQLLDYGFNFINTKIYIDNESTICIVNNPIFPSKTNHIEIRHHFIRDAYEKKLIQVLKIHTHDNVADLLTKAFDVSSKKLASPKQMALGKDISNPLIVGRLPKTTLTTSTMVSAIICLATNHKFNFSSCILLSLVKNIEAGVPFFMFPRFVQLIIDHQLGDMSHHKDIYDNPSLTKKVFTNMKMVGTGFSRVVTALFDNMLVPAAKEVGLIQDDVPSIPIPTKPSTSKPHKKHKPKKQQPQAPKVPSPKPSPKHRLPSPSNDPLRGGKDSIKLKELMDLCTHLSNKVLELKSKVIDIKSTYKERIKKLEGRVDRVKEENKVLKDLHSVHSKVDTAAPIVEKEKSFKHRRIIADIGKDVKINLEEAQAKPYRMDLEHQEKVLSMQDVDDEEPTDVEEVLEVVKPAKLITEVVTTGGATTTAEATKDSVPRRRRGVVIQDPEEKTSIVVVHSDVKSKDKGKGILIKEPKSLKGQAQIEQDEAFARQLEAELNANINWNAFIEQVKRSERLNDNMSGYKMNYFKGMTYSEIRPLFEKHYKYSQAFLEEVNKEVTLPEKEVEVEAHKREEATPLPSKIPIVDYKIHLERNKPYFKIIIADGNQMLFLSFSTLLKNFNREYLESLWKLVKESQCMKRSKGRHGLAKRYPLTHFTLEQMLNNVRLEVEEESEMSLELLRGGLLGIIDFNILLLLFILSDAAWNTTGIVNTDSVIVNAVRHIS
uniref:Putative ribonuclease H-like domain-containing protein n=1 Tax=Tanacetum cinerariifolium TaxID=118510 RepID=A0A6L2KA51_TANCI|nr:putative ribonuclease H-like domain-containing protein [Tanacetum cinerariifolium]